MYSAGKSSGSVNERLQKLRRVSRLILVLHATIVDVLSCRGEQFRQAQNRRRSTAHLGTSSLTHRLSPSLPFSISDLIGAGDSSWTNDDASDSVTSEPGMKPPAGPIPRSWIEAKNLTSRDAVDRNTRAWRTTALSLLIHHRHSEPPMAAAVPSLVDVCFRILLRSFGEPDEFARELAPMLPAHLRCALVRYTAVHQPLADRKLYSLFGRAGHADGEIVVVGPQASLRDDALPFYRIRSNDAPVLHRTAHEVAEDGVLRSSLRGDGVIEEEEEEQQSWDADDSAHDDDDMRLHTLALISASFSMQAYLNFPPTLTRLALVGISMPFPVRRLPGLCPLLVVLDLSFNTWLCTKNSSGGAGGTLRKVPWQKWVNLQVLGLRECNVDGAMLEGINDGRWVDVEILQ